MKPIAMAGLLVLAATSGAAWAQERSGGDHRHGRDGGARDSAPSGGGYRGGAREGPRHDGGRYDGRRHDGGRYRGYPSHRGDYPPYRGGYPSYRGPRYGPSWGFYDPGFFYTPAPIPYAYAPGIAVPYEPPGYIVPYAEPLYAEPLYTEPVYEEPPRLYAPPPPPAAPRTYAENAPAARAAQPPPPRVERYTLSAKELFAFDQATVKGPQPKLDEIAGALERNPGIGRVTITGYTDRLGSTAYNLALSRRRAEAVKAYLVQRGVEAARLEAIGRGEANPVVHCDDRDRAALIRCLEPNRRVEVEEITIERTVR